MMCGALSAAVLHMLLSLSVKPQCGGSHCAAVLRVRWQLRSAAWVCGCENIAASVSMTTKTITALFPTVGSCAGDSIWQPWSGHR